jgi:hypothetical protein
MLTMNGTVEVELLSDYTPKLGDEFTLWTVARTFTGTPKWHLPLLPDGLYWDVSQLAQATGKLIVTDDPSGIGSISAGTQVSCQLFSLNGMQVAAFTSAKAEVAATARQQGVQKGTYVVKMNDGHRIETQKIIVK